MMGKALASLDVPVTKTTNCLIAATRQELPPAPDASPCIRCGACETVCPVQLLPQQLHWHAQSGHDAALEKQHLFDCIECGACSFVCPSHIPLVAEYRTAKQRIRLKRIETAKAEHARHRFEFRQARLAGKRRRSRLAAVRGLPSSVSRRHRVSSPAPQSCQPLTCAACASHRPRPGRRSKSREGAGTRRGRRPSTIPGGPGDAAGHCPGKPARRGRPTGRCQSPRTGANDTMSMLQASTLGLAPPRHRSCAGSSWQPCRGYWP